MSTALVDRSMVELTGFSNPVAVALSDTTLPVAPDTACTPPWMSTASAATAPTWAIGLAAAESPSRPAMPWRVSTRCAQTLPLWGSTIATVPPRRSAVRGTKMSRLVAAAGPGTATADASSNRPVRGSMGTSWPLATERPATALPSWMTSRGESLVVLAFTPASNWPAALFSRAKLASAAEETHTPPSNRSASCTVSPLDCTANRVRLEAATATVSAEAIPTFRFDTGLTSYFPSLSSQAATSSSARSASVTSLVDSACSTSRALRLLASFPGPPCRPRVPASASF